MINCSQTSVQVQKEKLTAVRLVFSKIVIGTTAINLSTSQQPQLICLHLAG